MSEYDDLERGLEETVGLMLLKHLSPVFVNEAISAIRTLLREANGYRADIRRLNDQCDEWYDKYSEACRERDEARADADRLREAANRLVIAVENISGESINGWEQLDAAADRMRAALAGGKEHE